MKHLISAILVMFLLISVLPLQAQSNTPQYCAAVVEPLSPGEINSKLDAYGCFSTHIESIFFGLTGGHELKETLPLIGGFFRLVVELSDISP